MDIAILRLHNLHLDISRWNNPVDVVSHLGAVQAQDYAMAKWALGLRLKNATDASIEKIFNDGEILRMHILRPTWHFVTPENIRWMLTLAAPRVKTFMGHYNKKLELNDELFTKTNHAIVQALEQHTYLTRQGLKTVLHEIGIHTDVQRLAHIVMWAELDGLICSGPRQEKQFTYALLDHRAPRTKPINKEESLDRLARLYFTSHGPAQLTDFSWWSGLSAVDAKNALESIKSTLTYETIGNKTYWLSSKTSYSQSKDSSALLLSIYDEYVIAYKDRELLGGQKNADNLLSKGNWLTAVMVYNGLIIGTWKRTIKTSSVHVDLDPFVKLSHDQQVAFESAIERYKLFINRQ